jgi:hypothetical protein
VNGRIRRSETHDLGLITKRSEVPRLPVWADGSHALLPLIELACPSEVRAMHVRKVVTPPIQSASVGCQRTSRLTGEVCLNRRGTETRDRREPSAYLGGRPLVGPRVPNACPRPENSRATGCVCAGHGIAGPSYLGALLKRVSQAQLLPKGRRGRCRACHMRATGHRRRKRVPWGCCLTGLVRCAGTLLGVRGVAVG